MPRQYKPPTLPVAPRLARKSAIGPLPERHPEYGPCLLWDGHKRDNGYGSIYVERKETSTHRAAWGVASGGAPDSALTVGHTCDIKHCIQTDGAGVYTIRGIDYPRHGHLFLCTAEANQFDKVDKARQARGDRSGRRTKPESYWGERNAKAVLTASLVTEIRSRYAAGGIRQVDLATMYGVRQATISSLLRRETWQHTP